MVYGLALHTTSPQLGLALSDFDQVARSRSWELGRELSTYLHGFIEDFLPPQRWSDLEFLAVAKGPGSFTGTRFGVTTARTLAQQLNLPLFAISTLAAIVDHQWQHFPDHFHHDSLMAVQLPARRQQYFVAIYQLTHSGLTAYLADTTMTPSDWQETLDQLDDSYQLIEGSQMSLGETAGNLLNLAYQQWRKGQRPWFAQAKPFYGQNPV